MALQRPARRGVGLAWIFCLLCLPTAAEEPPPEPQPPPPEGYSAPEAALQQVREWGVAGRAQVASLAATPDGRELLCATFGAAETPGRPAVLMLADPDGDRPAATQLALAIGAHLAAGSPLLAGATVHLVPLANPDAAFRAFVGEAPWRGAPVDDDRDGFEDEDPPDDLNGDGWITQMRVPDPAGDYLIDPADPRVVRRADRDRGEAGTHRLETEGLDNDGDRRLNEDGPGGVRLEANWPHRYREGTPAAGQYQLSEPEARGLADFVLAHPELIAVVVLGSEDNLSTRPRPTERPDINATAPLAPDLTILGRLADALLEGLQTKPRGAPDGAGNFADWCYHHAGILTLESAVWSPRLRGDGSDEAKLLRWQDEALGGDGFVAWSAFEHPTLGAVEIGGWKPLVRDNPPAAELAGIADRWTGFVDSLAERLPRLAWHKVEVDDKGGGLLEARATLVNTGGLPTGSAMGEITRRFQPVRVRLELPEGGQLLAGRPLQTVGRLRELGGSEEFRWLYRLPAGAAPARAWAQSQSAGQPVAELIANQGGQP